MLKLLFHQSKFCIILITYDRHNFGCHLKVLSLFVGFMLLLAVQFRVVSFITVEISLVVSFELEIYFVNRGFLFCGILNNFFWCVFVYELIIYLIKFLLSTLARLPYARNQALFFAVIFCLMKIHKKCESKALTHLNLSIYTF